MRKIYSYVIIFVCFLMFSGEMVAFSEEEKDYAFDFSVEPLKHDKQIDEGQRYFNLRLSPGEEEEVYVKISNNSEVDTIYEINVNQAYTSKSGYIEYNNSEDQAGMDESLRYPIDEIVSYDNLVMVPANSEKNIPIHISMPIEEFQGIILSGIVIEKYDEEQSQESLITNKFSYVVGLTLSETDDVVEREIVLNEVYPDVSFGKTSIIAKISNTKMASYGYLKYETSIINLDTNKEFVSRQYDNDMELAPNSMYNFSVDTNSQVLIPGNYQMILNISDRQGNKWDFNEKFEITKQEADRINKAAMVKPVNHNKYLFLGILTGVLVIGVIIYWRRKRL